MSLNFSGLNAAVDFSIGGAANLGNGPFTLIVLWRTTGTPISTGLLGGLNAGTDRQAMQISGSKLFGSGDFSAGFGTLVNGDWHWIALSKPAGAAHYRGHVRDYTTAGAWQHGESVGAGNHGDPGVSNSLRVGAPNGGQSASTGDVAVAAVFTAELSDAAIEAACTSALVDIMNASPVWAARFVNGSPSNIQDLVDGGNETSRSGTIADAADPPGYNFDLAVSSGAFNVGLDLGLSVAGDNGGATIHVELMNFGPAVTGVSACVCEGLANQGDPVCKCVLAYPAAMPWDYCDCDCPDGGSGQLASWTGRPYASTSFPQPDTPAQRPMDHACGPPYFVTPVTVEVARCFPAIGQNGQPPSVESVIAATMRMHRDASIMRQAIGCCLRDMRTARTIDRFFIGETVFSQPAGGCASVQVNYLIAVKHCICAS